MGEVKKSALLTSLPGGSEHTDFWEALLQKKEVRTAPIVLPSLAAVKPLTLGLNLSGEAMLWPPGPDACDECYTKITEEPK